MKKLVVVILTLMLITPLFADNSKRIEELTKEGKELIQRKQQLNDALQKIDIRLIQIQAIIDELNKQDEEVRKDKDR